MMYEIHGAAFKNKGAHLMILTLIENIRAIDPKAKFCIAPLINAPFEPRAQLRINQVFEIQPFLPTKRLYAPLLKVNTLLEGILPAKTFKVLGSVKRTQVDALLDISGYRYGDRWEKWYPKNFAALARLYKKQGKPVILFPQMLGPFNQKPSAAYFKKMFQYADSLYARDLKSWEAVIALCGDSPKLKQAPDITLSFKAQAVNAQLPAGIDALIVPNTMVFKNGTVVAGQDYIKFLHSAAKELKEQGYQPAFLIHETCGEDLSIAKEANALEPHNPLPIIQHEEPAELKGFLAQSKIIISSRFHACAGGLSSNVPVLSLGWASKYEELHKLYKVEELLLSDHGSQGAQLSDKIALVKSRDTEIRERLRNANRQISAELDTLWNDVCMLLKVRQGPQA